jgi:hypothetical protein
MVRKEEMVLPGGFDPAAFWERSPFGELAYMEAPVTPEMVAEVERDLQFKLPASYIALAQGQNGGTPKRTYHRTKQRTSWAKDHVALTGIYGIGRIKPCSLCGERGSRHWIEKGYPAIGVYFADCPSAGSDMLCLDYRTCGPDGEPKVVHVDQSRKYKITFVADNFAAFLRGLEDDEAFETDD